MLDLLARGDGPAANPFVEIPNRGKRAITLDLARIDVDSLRAVNPRI